MIPFNEWGSVDQDALRQVALDPTRKPMIFRLMFASLGWSNLSGHAEFAPGELARRLQVESKTGDLVTVAPSHLSNEIRRARNEGLIGPGSAARCLIAPHWFAKTGGRGGTACRFHGIKQGRGVLADPPGTSHQK